MKYELSPSILAADFNRLGDQIKKVEEAGTRWLHFDVMDGIFVPSISFGMPVLASLKKETSLFMDVHLMITDPGRYVDTFRENGADLITVHAEACTHLDRTISQIKETGCRAGVALNPATPISVLTHVLDAVDMVLLMTVNPGFGGQKYIPYCTQKVADLRNELNRRNLDVDIQVDGGVTTSTLPEVMKAGANIFVAGSAVFKGDITKNARELMALMEKEA
jgi:ribulose-phosphate 3-epimerase